MKNVPGFFSEIEEEILSKAKPKAAAKAPPKAKPKATPEVPKKVGPKGLFTSEDTHAFMPHSEEQKTLVDGIDLSKVKNHGEGWTSDWAVSGFTQNKNGTGVVVKGRMPDEKVIDEDYGNHLKTFTTAQREGLYHNIANFFGLGQYVPKTAVIHDKNPGADPITEDHGHKGNHYSVMEKIPGARHFKFTNDEMTAKHPSDVISHQESVIKNLHETGELHKIAMMNAILGNTDRHDFNYMISPKGLHLIDHGFTFDHNNKQRTFVYPGYLSAAHRISNTTPITDKIHPDAKKWLLNLNEEEVKKFFKSHKVHSDFVKPVILGLEGAKQRVKSKRDLSIGELLAHLRDELGNGKWKLSDLN